MTSSRAQCDRKRLMLTLFWLVLTLVTLVVLLYTNAAGVTWIVAVAALLGLSWAGGLLLASLNVTLTALLVPISVVLNVVALLLRLLSDWLLSSLCRLLS